MFLDLRKEKREGEKERRERENERKLSEVRMPEEKHQTEEDGTEQNLRNKRGTILSQVGVCYEGKDLQ